MMRVALVSMPFAPVAMPSLALTQLASVLTPLAERVRVETHYVNLAFARSFMTREDYAHPLDGTGFMTGVGDWFFRQVAFPEAVDNTHDYLDRFYFEDDPSTQHRRAWLQAARGEVEAFLDALIATLGLAEADVVGFTALYAQTVASFAMAQRIKRINPDVVTVMGGAACEGVMGRTLARNVPQIDFIFSGPGLVSFPEFIRRRLDGASVESIPGVFSASTQPDRVAPVGEDLPLDQVIPLDYGPFLDQLEASFPEGDVRPGLLFETSRGCAWAETSACTFCGLNGLRCDYRAMSSDDARHTIEALSRWVPRCSYFIAVDTMMPRAFVEEVFPRLRIPDGMKMMYEVRPDLDAGELQALYDAGVVRLQPGIESLATPTLKLMRKGLTAFRNLAFLKAAATCPVELDWNLLIFSPGESRETYATYQRELPRLAHLPPPRGVFPVNFVRFSRYLEHPDEYDLQLEPQDFYALTYPFAPEDLRRIATHFVDGGADLDMMDEWLGLLNAIVSEWRARWLGSDGRPQARLQAVARGTDTVVIDTRSGELREVVLPASTADVMRILERPATLDQISRAFDEVTGFCAADEVARLARHGWLFEEEGRYMSLVLS